MLTAETLCQQSRSRQGFLSFTLPGLRAFLKRIVTTVLSFKDDREDKVNQRAIPQYDSQVVEKWFVHPLHGKCTLN